MDLFPTIGSGPWALNLTAAAMTVIAIIIVLILARMATARLDVRNPRGMQNFMEWVIEFVTGLAKDTVGSERAMNYVPLAFTLIIFLFVANQMGVILEISGNTTATNGFLLDPKQLLSLHSAGKEAHVVFFNSPTANLSVAMAMSIGMVGMTHFIGLKSPKNYFKHYVEPNPAFLIIHLIDEVAKFLTLGLRIFGNIFAGEVLIGIILGIPMIAGWIPVGIIPLLVWLGYSLFVGTIQAFVFTVLTLVYIGQKLPHESH